MKKIFTILLITTLIFTACKTENHPTRTLTIDPVESLFSQLTYLTKLSNDFYLTRENYCKYFNQLAGTQDYSPTLLDNEAVKTAINEFFENPKEAETFLLKLKELIKTKDIQVVSEICHTPENIYVTLSENTEQIRIATWQDGEFILSEAIQPLTGFVYMFAPEYLNEKHLIHRGYGDDGNLWWTFYTLDPTTQKIEMIEDCAGYFAVDEETKKFNPEEFSMTCNIEYKPAKASSETPG